LPRLRLNRAGAGALAALLLVATAAVGAGAAARHDDPTAAARQAIQGGRAKNVILFIGDGMGDSEITLGRYYSVGAAGRLNMDRLPLTGEYTTYAVDQANPSMPVYVPDSAATGTGWSTGTKTYNNAISVNPADQDLPTILEQAQAAGFATGDITTAELTDATPAVLASHVNLRACQGPADMATCPQDRKAAGGPGSIAEQMVDHHVDVLMGGGKARFDQISDGGPSAGTSVTSQAQAAGYNVVTDTTGMQAASAAKPVLGLFSSGNMPTEWAGSVATPFTTDTAANTVPTPCTQSNPARTDAMPHLSQMTTKSLELLEQKAAANRGRGNKGFFLQVEGASIDKQDHAANACAQIGETVEFDNAVGVGLEYARTHRDTLVIVTADHGHTSQIVEFPQTAAHHSAGLFQTLETVDGAPLVVSYATVASPPGTSQDHTGTEVRVAAQGPQAAGVLGITDQTDLYHTMARALGLE
jgi:alkaline phosphatase/streptomycin-6-phosphatase